VVRPVRHAARFSAATNSCAKQLPEQDTEMKNQNISPEVKHLVLIGGGHSHLFVLKQLGMNPVPGLRTTLISRDINTPYSGSLPGHISGLYEYDDIHIDLRPLAQFAGVSLIQEQISDIDLSTKTIRCNNRPDIEFDFISLNIGSRPDAVKIPGAAEHAIGIKPIDKFLQEWNRISTDAISRIESRSDYSMLIVGGGPASVEFALAAQQKIHKELKIKKYQDSPFRIRIVSADSKLLSTHNSRVQEYIAAELSRRAIEVKLNFRVEKFEAGTAISENESRMDADSMIFATGASIPEWPANCGLDMSDDGFIKVNDFLQSTSHEFVFAAGDAATIHKEPRPKSGVYAVRQGKPLAENLIRYATSKKLKPFTPQKHALALINMGNKTAIASRNKLFFQGRSAWHLKDSIDSRFLKNFSQFPEMNSVLNVAEGLMDKESKDELQQHAMRCAGCGAKVSGSILDETLDLLPKTDSADILSSGSRIEDAAVISLEKNRVLLQSVDQIKAFINDPWLFARIATNHCLSDIYAMGAEAHSALAVVGVPLASKKLIRSQLSELMLGCAEALKENECSLIGGHSSETSELQFGLSVNGFAEKDGLLSKEGMNIGDVLILTKALGTGTLFAADMRYKAKHVWINNALEQMLISNRLSSQCFVQHKATSCTDVTGFGLAGHLFEMLETRSIEVEMNLSEIPALSGALDTLQQGIISSLHKDNSVLARDIYNSEAFLKDPKFDLLFDPQTSGGLLASVPIEEAENCLKKLHSLGLADATIIGRVSKVNAALPAIILR
jgi:selenide, water dikinase